MQSLICLACFIISVSFCDGNLLLQCVCRSRGLKAETARACLKLTPIACVENEGCACECCSMGNGRFSSLNIVQYYSGCGSAKFNVSRREFSSQADVSNTKEEEDLEDGFSELGTSAAGKNDEAMSKSDVSDGDEDSEESQSEMELSDTEAELTEKKTSSRGKRPQSEMVKAILEAPGGYVRRVMDKWVEEGKDVQRQEISLVMIMLRKRRMYGKALQVNGLEFS